MRTITILLLLVIAYQLHAQNSVVYLDGSNDHIYSDFNAANDARTIEFWFKPEIDYDSILNHFATLISRDPGYGVPNNDVFTIAIQHSGIQPGGGFLNFTYSVTDYEYYTVLSDDNYWEADKWYHVAAIIHPELGMMLFIDGKKQEMVTEYFNATGICDLALCIGHWGYPPTTTDRFFNGSVDDVRISSIARYAEDFSPPCPHLQTDEYTKALWNFNNSTGNILADSSGHEHYAFMVGGMLYEDDPCGTTDTEPDNSTIAESKILVYPVPANDMLHIVTDNDWISYVSLLNIDGNVIYERELEKYDKEINIDVSNLPSGSYLVTVNTDEGIETKKVIIQH